MGFFRYGALNHRSGFQRVMWHYSDYVKLWLRCNNIGTLTDLKGNNNLTASGAPTISESSYIRLGRPAVDFDGAADYYSITDAAQTGLDLNGAELGGANLGFEDGNFGSWTEVENGTSTMDINAVGPIADTKDAKMTVDAVPSTVGIRRTFGGLTQGRQYTVQFKYEDDNAANTIKYYIHDTVGKYLQNDGTWAAAANWFTPAGSVATALAVKPFILSPPTTSVEVAVYNNASPTSTHQLDDFSITECFDAVILVVAKTTDTGNIIRLLDKRSTAAYGLYKTADNKITVYITDGTHTSNVGATTVINDGNFKFFDASLDRDSATGGKLYVNGSQSGASVNMTPFCKLDNAGDFNLGSISGGASGWWLGSVAEVMILTGSPLPAWVLSANFAAWVDNFARKWPLEIPHAD